MVYIFNDDGHVMINFQMNWSLVYEVCWFSLIIDACMFWPVSNCFLLQEEQQEKNDWPPVSELENGSNFHVRFDDSEHNFELKVSLITVHFCVHLHEVVGSDRRYTLLATGVNFLSAFQQAWFSPSVSCVIFCTNFAQILTV